jgi:hypothetical protein
MELHEQTIDAAGVIAEIFEVTPQYVRMIIAGTRDANSDNAKAIKKAYRSYIKEKKKLINVVKKLSKG